MTLSRLRPLAVAALASAFVAAGLPTQARDTKQPVSQDPQSVRSGKTGEGSPPADAVGGATMGAGGTSAQDKSKPRNDVEKRSGRAGEGSGDPTTTQGDPRTDPKSGHASGSSMQSGDVKAQKGPNDSRSGMKGEGSANPPKSSGSTTPNS